MFAETLGLPLFRRSLCRPARLRVDGGHPEMRLGLLRPHPGCFLKIFQRIRIAFALPTFISKLQNQKEKQVGCLGVFRIEFVGMTERLLGGKIVTQFGQNLSV